MRTAMMTGALLLAGLLGGCASSEMSMSDYDHPFGLRGEAEGTAGPAASNYVAAFTNEKNQYRADWAAGINTPPTLPAAEIDRPALIDQFREMRNDLNINRDKSNDSDEMNQPVNDMDKPTEPNVPDGAND